MENLLNAVECAINEDDHHIYKDPIGLSCGHFICQECIPKNGGQIVCSKCKIITRLTSALAAQLTIKTRYLLQTHLIIDCLQPI